MTSSAPMTHAMPRWTRIPGGRVLCGFLGLLLVSPVVPPGARAETQAQTPAADEFADPLDRSFHPQTRDWLLVGSGVGLAALGKWVITSRTKTVPPEGLDPGDIALDLDRRSLDTPDPDRLGPSTALALTSALYPAVLAALTPGQEGFWERERRLGWIETESLALALGASVVLKNTVSRPRPYTYLSEGQRGDDPAYDAKASEAFQSFPSGHATLAWASVMTGVSLLAQERPDLPPVVHAASGFAAGALATATSLLRVKAGVHFPTDVLAGAGLGAASGVIIPLIHSGETFAGSPRPSGSRGTAWGMELLGVALGTAAAFLVVPQ